jgi:hypothetical protein
MLLDPMMHHVCLSFQDLDLGSVLSIAEGTARLERRA